jgi:hypothetical protein
LRILVGVLLLVAGCGRTTPYRSAPPTDHPACALELVTPLLDFGALDASDSKALVALIRNTGQAPCDVGLAQLVAGTAPAFSFAEPGPGPVTLESTGDELSIKVRFSPGPAEAPPQRTGAITLSTTDARHPSLTVELRGSVKLCDLHVTPSPLDFGNVTLNATAVAHLTLANQGAAKCEVTRIVFGPGTDSNFAFALPPGFLSLPPGASTSLQLVFKAATSAPPYQRAGSVLIDSNDLAHPELVVPLSAFINTVCTQAGQYIYTVDSNGMFSRFDPTTLTSLDIAPLNCPSTASPFSMNVDQKGIAWVVFDDGSLFRVDTANASCTATTYQQGQHGFTTYGMGSVFDSNTGIDTLYLASGLLTGSTSQLGTLSFPSLTVSPVATIPIGWLELAGTGDGQLWGYAPSGSAAGGPLLARIDRTTGGLLDSYAVPEIVTIGGFALKFFGGAFYIFVGPDVWRIYRSTLVPGQTSHAVPATRVLTNPGRDIVGAGVSTCAPVQN